MKGLLKIGNNLDKLIAFTPSLDPKWRKFNRVNSPTPNHETLDIVEGMMDKGWEIVVSTQQVDGMKRVVNNMIKFQHPDIAMREGATYREGVANSYVTTSFDSKMKVYTNLGMERLICTNGLISTSTEFQDRISLVEADYNSILKLMEGLETSSNDLIERFNKLKMVEINKQQQYDLAMFAIKSRFGYSAGIELDQLLKTHRDEDQGNNVWKVYNRVQENISKPNMIIDVNGKVIGGIENPFEDKRVNQELYNEALKLSPMLEY